MSETVKSPESCQSMEDVRAGVDDTDRKLVRLLEQRFGYMRAAARIKPNRSDVRDEKRKASVIKAVREHAEAANLPAAQLAEIWDMLVEASIAYEHIEWDRLRN